MIKTKLNIIQNWQYKNLICAKCGTDKSVKYLGKDNNTYCNKCIIIEFLTRTGRL